MSSETLFEDSVKHVLGLAKGALAQESVAVSIGGSTVMKPSEFVVRELVQSATFSDRSTSSMGMGGARGSYRVEFDVACEAWCKKASLEAASSAVQRWCLLLVRAVARDKTLGGIAVHAEPYFSDGGTAVDGDNHTYIADITFGIPVKAEVDPASDN